MSRRPVFNRPVDPVNNKINLRF
ncbi:hypothetical protein SPHINGOT1_80063 [Sphingomonas sp. T1]|nr:hypothetical protein SPHINGOT1_80063 [Sphingomonas sp. T1]